MEVSHRVSAMRDIRKYVCGGEVWRVVLRGGDGDLRLSEREGELVGFAFCNMRVVWKVARCLVRVHVKYHSTWQRWGVRESQGCPDIPYPGSICRCIVLHDSRKGRWETPTRPWD